jgi:hypothetical protein
VADLAGSPFTVEAFDQLLNVQQLVLPAARVAQAVEGFQGLAPGLIALRRFPLAFLEDVPEPADADRWIERGG